MLGGVVFSTLRTFLADNAGIGLPLGIERVIWIGSKSHCFKVKALDSPPPASHVTPITIGGRLIRPSQPVPDMPDFSR
jgi:hypothetical protein